MGRQGTDALQGGQGSHPAPDLAHEQALFRQGFRLIAGVDEAGRGAWAGPLVAAAVVLPSVGDDGAALREQLSGVRDSKLLSPDQRLALVGTIQRVALGIGVGRVEARELDRLGLTEANRLAWRRAVDALAVPPDYLLLDAFRLPGASLPQTALIRGDSVCLSIAAASIIAKVTRDQELAALDAIYPVYGFGRHKGYGTRAHHEALARHGACRQHRQSFAPLRALAAGVATQLDTKAAPP